MGRLTRETNWANHPLGQPDTWPVALRISLGIVFNSGFPKQLFWGPDLTVFYNDAFRPSLGDNGKHPAVGKRAEDMWSDVWDFVGPLLRSVMETRNPVWFEDRAIPWFRNGRTENMYWTFSYSPVIDENDVVMGVLVTCVETTEKINLLASLSEAYDKEQQLNEEMTAINEELSSANEESQAVNEELLVSNEELMEAQEALNLVNSQLARSEELFRTMAEDTDVLISTSDEHGNAVYFNKAWSELTGRSVEELKGRGWHDIVHPDDFAVWTRHVQDSHDRQVSFSGQFRVKGRNGDYRWLLNKVPARFHTDGSFAGFIGSAIDITEQKQDDQRKSDFIGMASHELKTPLTTLQGYLQVLQLKYGAGDDNSIMHKALNQVKKMTTLINGFLNVSRLESGKITLEPVPFLIDELVKEMIEESQAIQSTHRLLFHECDSVLVEADRDKIGSVISNLLSNAVKYAPGTNQILVRCAKSGDMVRISIRDDGPGIQPEDQQRLFDRYYRVKNNRQVSGFGIGLYLSAEIIHRHRGEIGVESQPGHGAEFWFTIPLA